ncbi:MAG: endolytic transglycosylase MltG [Atopobiaceae bacterium]|nr:endolytic transglycosylase MltG [Atopobiaceae bacterium]
MPTSTSPDDAGAARKSPAASSNASDKERSKSAPRQRRNSAGKVAASSTGSISSTNSNRRRSGTTGSLSATNPNRRRTGATGSLSATNPNRRRGGTTGTLSGSASGRQRTGRTNPGSKPHVAKGASQPPKHSAAKLPSTGRSVLLIGGIALVVVAFLVGGFFVVRRLLPVSEGAQVPDGQTVTVAIAEGSDGATIIQTLLDAGVIHSSKDFMRAVNEQNADQSLRSGTYTFTTGSDPADVVRQLVAGPNTSEAQLQVPEGLTVEQTAQLVEESLGIASADFMQQAKASNYVEDYSFLKEAGNDSLEGFLYPKTYNLAGLEKTPDAIIRMMLSQFEAEFSVLDTDAARKSIFDRYGLNATDYDFIKIASIIEKEALNEDDRAKVSSVFYNRLSINMALQSDATIGYVNGGLVDTEADSPYNTYRYKGLPPTPICSASEWAIEAAMNPSDTDYLFFFIIEDGDYSNHTFTKTFEEHDAAYAAALAELRQRNGE